MANIWRPVDFDSLHSQVNEEQGIVEISSDDDDKENQMDNMDSFGLPEGGKYFHFNSTDWKQLIFLKLKTAIYSFMKEEKIQNYCNQQYM